jgi:predicted lactoylglutathione lyase
MIEPNFIMLYVDSPAKSADFYTRLFGKNPVEASPTFALFILDSGIKFGLWSKHTVEPAAQMTGGGGEVAFSVVDSEQVDATYSRWVKQGLSIAQEPVQMDFGYTFVALDPDNHRLRVYTMTEE